MKSFKAFIVLVMSTLFLSGCFGTIKIIKDDFKNASIVQMELNHNSEMTLKGFSRTEAVYTREFTGSKKGAAVINCRIITNGLADNLQNKVIFKVGEKNIELSFGDITGEIHTQVGKSNVTGNMETNSRKIFSTKLTISNELENALISEKKIGMRLYLGTEPSTYKIEGDDLLKIKNFLLSTPEKIADEKAAKPKSTEE